MAHSLNYKINDIFPRKKEKIFSLDHMTFPVCSFALADFFISPLSSLEEMKIQVS